jgi:hypothetical protein
MLEDFEHNVSKEMTEWAIRFYARYGFDLDVDPPASLRVSIPKAAKYALRKSKGVMPDMRDRVEATREESALIAKLDADIAATVLEMDEASRESGRALARLQAIQAEVQRVLNDPNATGADRGAVGQKLHQISADLTRATAKSNTAHAKLKRLEADKAAAEKRRDAKLDAMDWYQGELRAQMTEKLKKDGIGDEKRLNVVFCRFESLMAMRRPDSYTTGFTADGLKDPYYWLPLKLLMWTAPFVMVNIKAKSRNVVAHEVIHAAGHLHPVRLELEKQLVGLQLPKSGIFSGSPPQETYSYGPQYVVVGGGEYDGPEENIMNYKSSDDPSKSVLLDRDRDLLANAFFVRT